MVFDASIFQNLGRGVTPIMGPMEIATQGQQLRNLANQGKIQDMQVQGLNRQAQNEQQLRDVMKQFGGDEERALTELRKVGTPQALDLHDKILTASENKAQRELMYKKTYLEMSQKEQEAIDYAAELVGNAARAVKAAPGEAQPQLWAQSLDDLSTRLQPAPTDTPRLGEIKAKMVQQMRAEKQALLTGQGALRLDEHINSSLTTKQWIEQAKEMSTVSDHEKFEENKRHARAMEAKPGGAIVAMGKPPSGYRYTGDGGLEPIPGGPADRKIAAEGAKKEDVRVATQVTIDAGKRLLEHPGLAGAVGTWGLERKIPGTDAASFAAELDAFKAQNFIPAVQALRGMGHLSDQEGKKLTDAVGALEYTMAEKDFKSSLARIIARLEEALNRKPAANPTATPGDVTVDDLNKLFGK